MKSTSLQTTVILVVLTAIACISSTKSAEPKNTISRNDAIADIRELSSLLENAHPDPYIRGGGKISFHRRLQQLIKDIPPGGIRLDRFSTSLKAFVAAIGDGHTIIQNKTSTQNRNNPGGVPLYFNVVEDRLYVQAVANQALAALIGHTLTSVHSVPFAELIERQKSLKGYENNHQLLASLGTYGSLYFSSTLAQLIPEWRIGDQIAVGLRQPGGKDIILNLAPSQHVSYPLIENPSTLPFPDFKNRWFHYHFIGENHNTAYLAITSMATFREAFEYWRAKGDKSLDDLGRKVYRIINQQPLPKNYAEVIKGIPSASKTFAALFVKMKKYNTQTLIVDLTKNRGGLDLMNPILLYYLVGFDKTVSLAMKNSEVRKCSSFLENSSRVGLGLEAIPYAKQVPLGKNDYDFSKDPGFDSDQLEQAIRNYLSNSFRMMPSFIDEFNARDNEALYRPQNIVVLSSATTFSAGFNLLTDLYRLGARTVGVASGQAGNSFGNIRSFTLSKSKIRGNLSTKYFEAFPGDPQKGKLLPVHIPITYQDLHAYQFDKHSTLRLALDHL